MAAFHTTPPWLLQSFHPFFLSVPWPWECIIPLTIKKKKRKNNYNSVCFLLRKKFLGCTLVSQVFHVVTPAPCTLRHSLATWRLREASSQSWPAWGLPVPQECLTTPTSPTCLWTVTKPLFVQQPVKSSGLPFVEKKTNQYWEPQRQSSSPKVTSEKNTVPHLPI